MKILFADYSPPSHSNVALFFSFVGGGRLSARNGDALAATTGHVGSCWMGFWVGPNGERYVHAARYALGTYTDHGFTAC